MKTTLCTLLLVFVYEFNGTVTFVRRKDNIMYINLNYLNKGGFTVIYISNILSLFSIFFLHVVQKWTCVEKKLEEVI